ncbi:hypothetical protein EYC84_001022 [Monilinia fructicola]|uniref:Uncharacterized protein n=1 Tax=Monilinia fructicola TaxID=38448 RepID=A0A5M9JR15_MONFR|nr:hypothetical protein EYC84_001022 [Monilinia fructicola]
MSLRDRGSVFYGDVMICAARAAKSRREKKGQEEKEEEEKKVMARIRSRLGRVFGGCGRFGMILSGGGGRWRNVVNGEQINRQMFRDINQGIRRGRIIRWSLLGAIEVEGGFGNEGFATPVAYALGIRGE